MSDHPLPGSAIENPTGKFSLEALPWIRELKVRRHCCACQPATYHPRQAIGYTSPNDPFVRVLVIRRFQIPEVGLHIATCRLSYTRSATSDNITKATNEHGQISHTLGAHSIPFVIEPSEIEDVVAG